MILNSEPVNREKRKTFLLWISLIVGGVSAIGSLTFLFFFLQTGFWQLVIGVMGCLFNLTILIIAHYFIRREKFTIARHFILSSLCMVYIILQLVWEGYTLTLIFSGLLLLVPLLVIILPHKPYRWVLFSAMFGALILAIEKNIPYSRLKYITDISLSSPMIIAISVFILLTILWHKHTYYRNDSIGKHLTRTNTTIVLLTTFSIVTFVAITHRHSGKIHLVDKLNTLADFEMTRIDHWLDQTSDNLELINAINLEREQINLLLSGTSEPASVAPTRNRLQQDFANLVATSGTFAVIMLLDSSGNVVASNRTDDIGKNFSRYPFFLSTQSSHQPTITLSEDKWLSADRTMQTLVFTRPIIAGTAENSGFLVGIADFTVLSNLVLDYGENPNHIAITMIDRNGHTIAHHQDGTKLPATQILDLAGSSHKNTSAIVKTGDNQLFAMVYRWIPTPGFALIIEQNLSELLYPVYLTVTASAILALLSAIIGTIATSIASRSITDPLHELVETSRKIADGNLNLVVDENRGDELGLLAKSFNRMTNHLSTIIHRLKENIQKLESAQNKLLIADAEWEQTFDTVPDAIIILDTEYKIKRLNQATASLFGIPFGVPPDEFIGKTCHQLFHKSDSPPDYCPHRKLLADNKEHVVEFQIEGGGYVLETDSPLYSDKGELIGSVHVTRDISTQKEIEQGLKRASTLISALSRSAARLTAAHDASGLMDTLGDELRQLGISFFIALKQGNSQVMAIDYFSMAAENGQTISDQFDTDKIEFTLDPHSFPYYTQVLQEKQPVFIEDALSTSINLLSTLEEDIRNNLIKYLGITRHIPGMFIPLIAEENVLGIFGLWGESIEKEDISALSIFARQVAVAIEKSRLFENVQRLAKIDDLTGVPNRRHLFSLGTRELNKAKRFGFPLSTIMLDLDHFKQVNDTYGHATGDQVLREVAVRCHRCTREIDIFGRYGGEEFALVLPNTRKEDAVSIADRLRKAIAAKPIHTDIGNIEITISIGVAELDEHIPDLATLLDRADTALYAAKNQGRNCVVVYPPPNDPK